MYFIFALPARESLVTSMATVVLSMAFGLSWQLDFWSFAVTGKHPNVKCVVEVLRGTNSPSRVASIMPTRKRPAAKARVRTFCSSCCVFFLVELPRRKPRNARRIGVAMVLPVVVVELFVELNADHKLVADLFGENH